MTLRLHPVCAFFLVALSACSSFDGRAVDAGAPADMNVAVDAGADAALDAAFSADAATDAAIIVDANTDGAVDAAVSVDAAVVPVLVVPAELPSETSGQMVVVTVDGLVGETETTSPPDEPYCVATQSTRGGGRRWATCAARESKDDCERGYSCPEYSTTDRALGCAFDGTSARPTCVPLQYDIDERCAECEADGVEQACLIRPNGEISCLPGGFPATVPGLANGPVCARDSDGELRLGTISDGTVALTADVSCDSECFFTHTAVACVPPADPIPRYPLRGCTALGDAPNCFVGNPPASTGASAYRRDEPTHSMYCTAIGDAPLAREWQPNMASDAMCDSITLCDLSGASAACVRPRWSRGTGTNQVCGDCLGVPCFVYEDGSYECTHTPTRTVDATRVAGSTVECCRWNPTGGSPDVGTCGPSGFALTSSSCSSSTLCSFTPAGVATCE